MIEEFAGNDRFSIVRRLGAGGMGIVYEAVDRETEMRVALKTLRDFDAAGIYRFKLEFRALTELVHANLLPFYELFCEGDRWFFTMELVEDASDLLSYLRRGTVTAGSPTDATMTTVAVAPAKVGEDPATSATVVLPPSGRLTLVPSPSGNHERTSVFNDVPASQRDSPGGSPASLPSSASSRQGQSDSSSQGLGEVRSHAGGEPVRDYARLKLVFAQVARGVCALHAAGKLHRDLKPANVLVHADGRAVVLDFGLVAELKAQPATTDAHALHVVRKLQTDSEDSVSGTVSYMAPEQVMGLPLLESSDWYSFGVMLYEALTGRLPYEGRASAVLRAKLEQDAPPPMELTDGVPEDLNALCVQLLHRTAERRPEAARILECLSGETAESKEGNGELAEPTFVGRERYLEELATTFSRLKDGRSEVLCVHGRSGLGKSTLLQHFLDSVATPAGAVVLQGRCYEHESVPYKAVDDLIDALTRYLLAQPPRKVGSLLPAHTAALARIFPVLKRVAPVAALARQGGAQDPRLVRQQAFAALGHLLGAIGRERPLVLFVDDLQWGDTDSALLLTSVLGMRPAPKMLLLLSYRSEYAERGCVREFRKAWEKTAPGSPLRELEVEPLNREESRILAQRLLGDTAVSEEQLDRIAAEARGSAFFVQELVQHARGGMEWSTTGSDLDEVLWRRVNQLPEQAKQLLEIISLAGQPLQIGDLVNTRVFEQVPQQSVNLLRATRLVRSTGPRLDDQIEAFHDRIRESVSGHLSETISRDYHQRLADALEANAASAPETIAGHLQAAGSARAAMFYELAGERAIKVLAFDLAEEYLKQAASLAATDQDRVHAEERLVHFYTDTARFADAYRVGSEAVARFGVKLPKRFMPPLLLLDLIRARLRTGRRKPSALLGLPVMADERRETVVRMIAAMAKAAYQVRPEICVAICTRAVNLCLAHGNTRDAAVPYMVFGCIFLGGIMGRSKTGHEFGRLALGLVDKFENEKQRAEVNFVVGYFGTAWVQPSMESERLWEVAFLVGQQTGDLFHTGCAAAGTVQNMLMRGASLPQVEQKIQTLWPVIERAHLREPMTCMAGARRVIANLRGETVSRDSLSAADFDEEHLLAELSEFGSRHFAHFHFLNKMMLAALWEHESVGLEMAKKSATYLGDSRGLLNTPEHYFWQAMLCASSDAEPRSARGVVGNAKRKFAAWAALCPENFGARDALLGAELARLKGDLAGARAHYDEAVRRARGSKALHLEGYANRRVAVMAAKIGDNETAIAYNDSACAAFSTWGASALVESLLRFSRTMGEDRSPTVRAPLGVEAKN